MCLENKKISAINYLRWKKVSFFLNKKIETHNFIFK